ncbi:putative 2OG-Fe(II) oxygenase [Candidatus Pelagibacter sp. HIMB1493]|uniref:putative 2OG-Fe(II) oxygenase n=1 Tax=Candidatus Pelagibacter sp. HIMB1493 TaxID=3413334 RepID=UPI003F84450E
MNDLEILQPFGPSIAKVSIPKEIIDSMNNYVDEILKDNKKSEILDGGYKLAGNVTQEFRLEGDFMKKIKWIDFLALSVQDWLLKKTEKKIKKFDLIASWVVRQFKNEYNPIHFHGGHVSGVGYLKVPDNMGKTVQKDKKNRNGNLVLVHGSHQFLSKSIFTIQPKVGDFYFFPNYVMHTVYPFTDTEEERRSVSFNAYVDQDIVGIV